MRYLESFGVQELNAQEIREVEGGLLGLILPYALQAVLVATLAAGTYASFKAGYDNV